MRRFEFPPGTTTQQGLQATGLGSAMEQAAFHIAGCYEAKGFGMERDSQGEVLRTEVNERLLLIHTETSETAQEVKRHWPKRKPCPHDVRERIMKESADTVIRVLNFMREFGGLQEIHQAFAMVHAANWQRPVNYNTADEEGK